MSLMKKMLSACCALILILAYPDRHRAKQPHAMWKLANEKKY